MHRDHEPAVRTLVYILNDSMISGARYHRVATYSVINPASFPAAFVDRVLRAKPKSQTLRSQLAFRRRLAGFRSRCTMSAECIVLRARRVWYTKYYTTSQYEGSNYCSASAETHLAMVIGELLRPDNSVKIRLHQLLDNWRV